MGTVLSEFSRGEINGDFAVGESELGASDGGTDAFFGFADGFVGEPDNKEVR